MSVSSMESSFSSDEFIGDFSDLAIDISDTERWDSIDEAVSHESKKVSNRSRSRKRKNGTISDRSQERLNAPQCWPREEKRQPHVPSTHFDDYDSLNSGPSHGKKRLRSSPLRTTRSSKLRDRERDRVATNSPKPNGSSSPKAGPSGSFDDKKSEVTGGSGYNSGDEYDNRMKLSESEWLEKKRGFEKKIRKKGWLIKHMDEDGACLFRAIADQVYGDQEMHEVVRKHCMDYIALNRDFFSHYVTEDFNNYLKRKRLVSTHGNHIEMQAMSEMYNRNIEVYCFGKEPMNTFHGKQKTDNEPIRLSYQSGHYNSIVDPHKATVGVGLGLPSFTPGAAEKNLLTDAVQQSEDFHIEQTMLEDKLRATDWEATNEAIEEQVARDSFVQWLKDTERQNKALQQCTSSTSTSTSSSSTTGSFSPPRAPSSSPKGQSDEPSSSFKLEETASFLTMLPPKFLGLEKWEDAGILAKVLATSQQEYLDNLKKNKNKPPENVDEDDDMLGGGPSTSR